MPELDRRVQVFERVLGDGPLGREGFKVHPRGIVWAEIQEAGSDYTPNFLQDQVEYFIEVRLRWTEQLSQYQIEGLYFEVLNEQFTNPTTVDPVDQGIDEMWWAAFEKVSTDDQQRRRYIRYRCSRFHFPLSV